MYKKRKPISALQYAQLTNDVDGPRVIPVDGTWLLNPAAQANGRTGSEIYATERIPNARFFDLTKTKDLNSPYPHMMPDKATFDSAMSQLGIKNDDLVVVYDTVGNFSAPRVYWMLRTFRHENSLLLDNYLDYKKEGLPIETGEPEPKEKTDYQSPGIDTDAIVLYDELKNIVVDADLLKNYNIIDVRPAERFEGAVAEPRPDGASGHMPGSKSLPFGQLLDENKHFKSPEELEKIILSKVDPNKTTIASCGSGVTACIFENAINQISDKKVRVYDGSWGEYSVRADPETMVIKGKEF